MNVRLPANWELRLGRWPLRRRVVFFCSAIVLMLSSAMLAHLIHELF